MYFRVALFVLYLCRELEQCHSEPKRSAGEESGYGSLFKISRYPDLSPSARDDNREFVYQLVTIRL